MERYVRSCDACQRNKVVRHAPFGLLSPLPIPTRPWLSVSLDWITDLPPNHYHDAVLVLASAFHPRTDGQTERLNSVLEQYLRMFCDYQQTDWASLFPSAEFSYNNSKHSATSLTPFFANYGFHPSMSLLPPSPSSSTVTML